MKIIKARIIKANAFGGASRIMATFENGTEKHIFTYYNDELSFSPKEFKGLTEDEARNLKFKKDKAYLQSERI